MSETWPFPRLYRTRDRAALVEESDPRAAFLAWSGHEPVPASELAQVLPPAGPSDSPEAGAKQLHDQIEDKAVRRTATKARR